MSDALRLGWSQSEAQTRLSRYRTALGLYLIAYAAVGVLLVLVPSVFGRVLDTPPHHGWMRPIGGLILFAAALQLPAWQDPVRSRGSALIAMIGRFVVAMVLLVAGGALLWVGLVEAVCAVGLAALLFHSFTAELMSRP